MNYFFSIYSLIFFQFKFPFFQKHFFYFKILGVIRRRILPFECEGQVRKGADILDEKKNKVGKVRLFIEIC